MTEEFTNFISRPPRQEWVDHFAGRSDDLHDQEAADAREAAANEWVELGLSPEAFLEIHDQWNDTVVGRFKEQHDADKPVI